MISFLVFKQPVLQTKFQGHRPFGSREQGWCRISERGFVLDNFMQNPTKFKYFHQLSHDNEIIRSKSGVRTTPLNPLWIRLLDKILRF